MSEKVTLLFYLTGYSRFGHALSDIVVQRMLEREQGIVQTLLEEGKKQKVAAVFMRPVKNKTRFLPRTAQGS